MKRIYKYSVIRRDSAMAANVLRGVGVTCWFVGEVTAVLKHTNWWVIAKLWQLMHKRALLIEGHVSKYVPTTPEEIQVELDEQECEQAFQKLIASVYDKKQK